MAPQDTDTDTAPVLRRSIKCDRLPAGAASCDIPLQLRERGTKWSPFLDGSREEQEELVVPVLNNKYFPAPVTDASAIASV